MNLEQNLNELLSDLNVFYRKLQNYHWNVTGQDFFQAHSKLEELYNEINEQIDEVAEHILILGEEPLGTLKDYLEKTNITEAENKKIKSQEVFQTILKDYKKLLEKVTEIKEKADAKQEQPAQKQTPTKETTVEQENFETQVIPPQGEF